MTVFPQPKAPGMAVVPPWTQLLIVNKKQDLRKERIQDTLSSQERIISSQFVRGRTGSSHRPGLQHGILCLLARKVQFQDNILSSEPRVKTYGEIVLPFGRNVGHCSCGFGRQHDHVHNEGVFKNLAVNVSTRHMIPHFEVERFKIPREFLVQGGCIDSSRNVNALREFLNVLVMLVFRLYLERSLDSIKNAVTDAFFGKRALFSRITYQDLVPPTEVFQFARLDLLQWRQLWIEDSSQNYKFLRKPEWLPCHCRFEWLRPRVHSVPHGPEFSQADIQAQTWHSQTFSQPRRLEEWALEMAHTRSRNRINVSKEWFFVSVHDLDCLFGIF